MVNATFIFQQLTIDHSLSRGYNLIIVCCSALAGEYRKLMLIPAQPVIQLQDLLLHFMHALE